MKLDRFEQFIKDSDLEPNLNTVEAKVFNRKLYDDFRDKYDDIASEVNGTIDFDEIYSNSIHQVESLNVIAMDNAIRHHTNNLIRKTLDDIDDIQEEVEPEDCMDIYKRDRELHRDD